MKGVIKAEYKAYMFCILTMFGWGSMFVACKVVYAVMSGMTLLFLRYLIAVVVMCFIYRKTPLPVLSKKEKCTVFMISVMGYLISAGALMLGTDYIDASLASSLNATTPVAIILFAIILLKEKMNIFKLTGIGITVVGAIVIVGKSYGNSEFAGVVLTAVGVLAWGVATAMIRKNGDNLNSDWMTIYYMGIAMVGTIPFMVIEIKTSGIDFDAIDTGVILGMLWLGLVSSMLANFSWVKALEILPASTCSMFYALLPVMTTLLGIIILGETLKVRFVVGCIVITAGIIIAVLGERKMIDQS